MKLVDVADEIFRELGEPDDITIPTVSFWLTSNVGSFSGLLNTDIIIVNSEFSPELTNEQKDIYKNVYTIYYWTRQVNKNLGAAAYDSFSQIKEGDRTVIRTNKNEIAKSFTTLMRAAKDDLDKKLLLYRQRIQNTDVVSMVNPINDEDIIGTFLGPFGSFRFYGRRD